MVKWDSTFLNRPDDDRDAGLGDNDIRELKAEILYRLEREHEMQNTDETKDGLHRINSLSKKFNIYKSDMSGVALELDETAKTIKPLNDFVIVASDGSSLTKSLREVIVSIPGTLAIGTNDCPVWEIPLETGKTAKFKGVRGRLKTAPAGGNVVVNFLLWTSAQAYSESPTTLLATLTIAAGADDAEVTADITINRGDFMCISVTSVGSTTPGSDLSMFALYEY